MIEINLLPGKKKKAAGGGAGFKLALPDFRGLLASIKNPWLLAASAASLIVVGGGLLWFITQSTRLRVAQNRRIEVQAEKRRFDAVIAQKRQSERIRDSLVAEINVIRGIDADRYIWPHVLDQITKALPHYRQSQVMMLITLGMLALGYAFWNYWAKPTGEEIAATQAEIKSMEDVIAQAKADLASGTVEDLRRKVEEYSALLAVMRRLV